MNSRFLALRVTRNSFVMIFVVYLVMQVTTYFRDNILFGTDDISALLPSVGGFFAGSVLPPLFLFSLLIYLLALPIQKFALRLEAGETPSFLEAEKVRRKILRFSTVILVINLVGFALGFVLNMVLNGRAGEFFLMQNMVVLVSNLAGGVIYSTAQTALNNQVFAPVREALGIHSIGDRKKELRSTLRQMLISGFLVLYVLTFQQFNTRDVIGQMEITNRIIAQVERGEMQPSEMRETWKQEFLKDLPKYSSRTSLDTESLQAPWEREVTASGVQQSFFLMFFLFLFAVALFVQFTVSRDLADQLRALMNRVRDVISGGGDLKKRLALRNMDDVGELAELINKLMDQFQGIVTRISSAATSTQEGARAVEEVLAQAESVAAEVGTSVKKLASEMTSQTQEFQNLLEVLNSFRGTVGVVYQETQTQGRAVQETSSAMGEMSQSILSVAQMIRESEQLIRNLAEQGQEGGRAVKESFNAIAEIERSSRQVVEILGALNKIAADTNLLAMNAAIEAAHAGEKGLGFAVVADEVRKLANHAGAQTRVIREQMTIMARRVEEGVNRVKASGSVLENLVEGLNSTAAVSLRIAQAMNEQQERTRTVNLCQEQVVETAKHVEGKMGEQTQATTQISTGLEGALNRIRQLLEDSRRQASLVSALDQSFQDVKTEVIKNTQAVDALEEEIRRFKQ